MKRVVLISGVVYPNPSPPGRIALEYAEMIKEEFDVSIIFMQTSLRKTDGKIIDRIKYYSVFGLRLFLENFFFHKADRANNKTSKKIYELFVLLMKGYGRLESMFIFPNNLRWHYKKAFKKLLQLNEEKKIDSIFSLCSPFSAHLAARDFKKKFKNVHWVTYTVDPYATSERLNDLAVFSSHRNRKNLEVERQIFQKSDVNIVSEEVFETEKSLLAGLEDKTISLPYTLKRNNGTEVTYFPKDKINVVYAGRFYRDLRNPEYFLRSFLNLKNENILLHLYSASDCEDLIDQIVGNSNEKIIRHPQVPFREINNILLGADILVNVGNSVPEFKPSKTFEYISCGRPIIHFYRNNLPDETLNSYPLVIQVNEDSMSINESSKLIESFCIDNKMNTVQWEDIEKKYPKHLYKNIQNTLLHSIDFPKENRTR